jgi:hypothetical protein
MTAAIIVTLEIDDVTQLPLIAEEIHDELFEAGYDVVTVKPWNRPSLELFNEDQPTLRSFLE